MKRAVGPAVVRLATPGHLQRYGIAVFAASIVAGGIYTVSALIGDLVRAPSQANVLVFILLMLALLRST